VINAPLEGEKGLKEKEGLGADDIENVKNFVKFIREKIFRQIFLKKL
jgi:hypothetical protein